MSSNRQATASRHSADAAKLAREFAYLKLVNLVREAVLIVDLSGQVVFWNKGAEHLYGWKSPEAVGRSPLELLRTELPRPLPQIQNILRKEPFWDAELKQTTRQGARIVVASRWAAWRDRTGEPLGHFQLDSDITHRKQVERELRVLSGRLLTIRDEERRRWARELHDSVGQLLVGVTMNLSMLEPEIDAAAKGTKFLGECTRLTNQALREIRTISYLLHPPMLDEVGLVSALRWYVNGFSERSQIKVYLEIPAEFGRFRRELEIAVFRIVQEALSNVHRHSKSATAHITVSASPRHLRLKIEDQGKGMTLPIPGLEKDEAHIPGVGISGIRERVRQLGGQMQIRSGDWGTALEALFPVQESELQVASAEAGSD